MANTARLMHGLLVRRSRDRVDVATASEDLTDAGELLEYTVEYGKLGYGAADSVVIDESVPAGTRYVPGSLRLRHGATADFFPDEARAERFEVRLGEPLAALSTFWRQFTTHDWRQDTADHVVRDNYLVPIIRKAAAANQFSEVNNSTSAFDAVDFNGDGHTDLVLCNWWRPRGVFLNDGAGYFTRTPSGALDDRTGDYPAGPSTNALVAFDADGDPDPVSCDSGSLTQSALFVNDDTGHFDRRGGLNISGSSVDAADIDGVLDVVAGRYDGSSLWLNDRYGNVGRTSGSRQQGTTRARA
jgi:uncharacterized repeat protein (TIGR01451 family)